MAKSRGKARFVLHAIATVGAVGAAMYYRNAYHRELEVSENMIEVPPEKMREIQNTDASIMISYVNGQKVVELIRPEK